MSQYQMSGGQAQDQNIQHIYLTYSTDLSQHPVISRHKDYAQLSQYSNPKTWPDFRKSYIILLSCLATFVTTYAAGSYTAGQSYYISKWNLSEMAATAGGLTAFVLPFAIGPMVLSSLSELTGRRPLFLITGFIYVLSQLGSGLTDSFSGMIVSRALAGASSSVFSTVVAGVISDMYANPNTPMAILTGTQLSGAGTGPMLSGIIVEYLDWRWIFHLQAITCGLVIIAMFFFFRETRGVVLLSRKANLLNKWQEEAERQLSDGSDTSSLSPGDTNVPEHFPNYRVRWKVRADEERASAAIIMKTSLLRPIRLLVMERVVFWFSLWMSFAGSILYLCFEAVPLLFVQAYGFTPQAIGLCFSPVPIASIIGTFVAIWNERLVSQSSTRFSRFLPQRDQPEARLVLSCGQSLFLPIGLIWLGTTATPTIHWIVPVLSVGSITLGIFSVYLAVYNYLAETYHFYASSALAGPSFCRNLCAAFMPLAVEPMFVSLGPTGVGCLLGGIGLILSAVPWVLVLWGPRIREKTRVAAMVPE